MTLLLALSGWDPAPWLDRFGRLLPGRRVVTLKDSYDPAEIRYVAAWKHPPGNLENLTNLRAIFSLGAGVDHLLADTRLPRGVPMARVVDPDLTNRMSEYVVLHCLAHQRDLAGNIRRQAQRIWDADTVPPAAGEVRVGIMGLGVLGQDAAAKLAHMGFVVAGWSRSAKTLPGLETFAGEDGLGPFLARTDILVVLLPLTPDTRGILNAGLFRRLARDGALGGPILINAGRGGLQVETDILACLDAGVLKAATLDVFETEPLPQDSRLWTHPAVTVTPHDAAASSPEAVGRLVADQILALERGEPLRHQVERGRGY